MLGHIAMSLYHLTKYLIVDILSHYNHLHLFSLKSNYEKIINYIYYGQYKNRQF